MSTTSATCLNNCQESQRICCPVSKPGLYSITSGFASGDRIDLLHNTRTNSCHLRTVIRASDCCDCISTEMQDVSSVTDYVSALYPALGSVGNHQSQVMYSQLSDLSATRSGYTAGPKVSADCCCTY